MRRFLQPAAEGGYASARKHLLLRLMGWKHRRTESSMLDSLRRGRPTEIDFLNALVVRIAEQAGLAAPWNRAVCRLVGDLERGQLEPQEPNLVELARVAAASSRRAMRADRKQALLAAGVALFSRHGYREVSIEEIARSAGVGTGSFYTYFSGKEEFYEEILDDIEQQGRQEVDRLVASFESPLNQMKALYRFRHPGNPQEPAADGRADRGQEVRLPGQAARRERGDTLRHHIEEKIGEILAAGGRAMELRVGLFHDPPAPGPGPVRRHIV